MNQFFDDEDDGKDIETENKPVSAVENTDCNSLPSSGDDPDAPTGYVATKEEVLLCVKHWHTETLGARWTNFTSGHSCGVELRTEWFARRRIARADAAIGFEAVEEAVKEAREKFKADINDNRLWEIFENGTREQWEEVQAEFWREVRKQSCADALKEMDELQMKHDLIALVLHEEPADKSRPVLFFPTADSELVPLLEVSREFEVETDESRIRALIVDRELTPCGFIHTRRQGGDWLFDFPGSTSGTLGWDFLESVVDKIKKLVSAGMGRESHRA